MNKAYVIIWLQSNKQWSAQSAVWPSRILAEAQITLDSYRNPNIQHAICEIELPA